MNKKICTEVYDILIFLGKEYRQKVPKDLMNEIEKNIDKIYLEKLSKIQQNKKDSLYAEDTLAMIAFLNLKYWCKNKEKSEKLRNLYLSNDKI